MAIWIGWKGETSKETGKLILRDRNWVPEYRVAAVPAVALWLWKPDPGGLKKARQYAASDNEGKIVVTTKETEDTDAAFRAAKRQAEAKVAKRLGI